MIVDRYPYQLGPIGDSRKPATAPDGMLSIDRARIMGDALTAWPGYMRRTPTLARASVMGNPESPAQLQVVRFSQNWQQMPGGHGIAVVDRNSDSGSRVMGFGHMSAGRDGNALFSAACRTDEYEPLGAITVTGAYSGVVYADWQIETTSTTKFRWRKDGGSWTSGVTISTTPAQLGSDGPIIAWATTSGHASGEIYWITAGEGSAHLAAEMVRVGASDFPWIVVGDKATLIGTQFNAPLADDGDNVRVAGTPVPFLPPTVRTVDVTGATALFENACDATTDWTAATDCNIAATSGDTPVVKAEGTAALRMTVNIAASDAAAAFTLDLSGSPVNFAAGTRDRFRVWVYGYWQPERVVLGEALFFKITGGTGADIEIRIPRGYAINGRQWQYIDCAVDVTEAKTGATAFEVWISKQHIDQDFFGQNGADDFIFALDAFEYMEGANVQLGTTLDSNQVWWFKHSWTEDGKSGAPGPSSQPIELSDHAVQIDVAGAPFYYDVASTLDDEQRSVLNTPPAEATGFMIWVSNEGYPRSERFTIGDFNPPEFYRFSRNAEFDVTTLDSSGTNGQLTFNISSQQIAAALGDVDNATGNPVFPFYNYPPPVAKCACADGNAVVLGGGTDYSVGQWLFTDDYQVIFPVAAAPEDTPIVSEAWVGRTVRIAGETQTYTVGKALDTDGDGVLDALWIFTKRTDSISQIPIGAYSGTTEGKKATFVADKRTLRWTNVTQENGVDMTTASPLNELVNVFPENDEIKALFKVGEFLYALGANTMMVMRANDGAFSDSVVTTGLRYSNPTVTAGVGIAGARAWAPMSDGRIVWVGPWGEIFMASPSGGYERHPASVNLAGIMGGDGELLYTEMMEFVFAAIYREGGEDYLYIGLPSQLDDPTPLQQESDTVYGGVGLGVQNYSRRREAYNLLPYNWLPTQDQMDEDPPINEAVEAIWGPLAPGYDGEFGWPMFEIFGLAGGGLNYEGDSQYGVSYGAGLGDISEGYDKSVEWANVVGEYFSRYAYVEEDMIVWSCGDVSGAKTPAQNSSFMAAPTTNRNLPASGPAMFTDLTSLWDSITPIKGKVTSVTDLIESQTGTTLPAQWNNITQIHGWKGADPNSLGYGDAVAAWQSCPGVRLVGNADPAMNVWATAPTSRIPVAYSSTVSSRPEARVLGQGATIRGRIYVEGTAGQFLPPSTVDLIFRNVFSPSYGTLPAGWTDPSDVVVTIADAIPTNTWTEYEIELDPEVYNGQWTDRSGIVRNGIIYQEVVLCINAAIPDTVFNQTNNDLRLFFALGHVVMEETTVESPIPLEIPTCVPYGSEQVQTPEVAPYRFGILVNLSTGMAFTGAECQFTCAQSTGAVGCAIPGMAPAPLMMGDEWGYLSVMDNAILSWGSPSSAFVFLATAGTDDTATLDVSAYTPNPLTVDEDGNPTLNGLIACKIGRDAQGLPTREQRRITANTTSGITVAVDWTTNPVAGDTIVIGPLFALMKFQETRTTSRAGLAMLGFTCDVEQKPGEFEAEFATFDPQFQINTFIPSGRAIQCSLTPYATQRFTLATLEANEFAFFRRTQGVSFAWQIIMLGDARGRLFLRNPTLGGIEMSGGQRR